MTLPADLVAKLVQDTETRLWPEGTPRNPLNDYERHLYARKLRSQGMTRVQVGQALMALGLEDVSMARKLSYVCDVLDSAIVGFQDNPGEVALLVGQVKR